MINDINLNKRKIGDDAEWKCINYLENNKIKILEKNFRCKIGEIDIVGFGDTGFMAEKGYLIFFEVKFRNSNKNDLAECAVNYNKQVIISKVAKYYMMLHNIDNFMPIRFDVLAINENKINWYKNAFEYHTK